MLIDATQAALARRCAERLAPSLGPSLPENTERVLAERAAQDREERYDPATLLSFASLLVAMVGTGWNIYRDLRKDREAGRRKEDREPLVLPARDVFIQRLREETRWPRGLSEDQQNLMLKVVVDEWLSSGRIQAK